MKRLALIILLSSCVKAEIVNETLPPVTYQKPRREMREMMDTVKRDTTRVPITFNPTLEDWNDTTITITPSGKL